jgi:hypothetical protein
VTVGACSRSEGARRYSGTPERGSSSSSLYWRMIAAVRSTIQPSLGVGCNRANNAAMSTQATSQAVRILSRSTRVPLPVTPGSMAEVRESRREVEVTG